ncbi:glycosyl hydrolase 53 family protein [Carboxylicivirga sp. RSCT41]|uniref:glycosyl hydrolase 53 family protein n=1 Tax=Carboxylicivirga agarovorans TaxID=3417570 RepID=UPI003D34A950
MKFLHVACLIAILITIQACSDIKEEPAHDFFSQYSQRQFEMGFSTWIYAPEIEALNNTYRFIADNGDIYCEHIDNSIPWNALINDQTLPAEFTDEIESRVTRKIQEKKLLVSVSLLNIDRDDLASDFDGSIPEYFSLDDQHIEDAYYKHLAYIAQQLQPDYVNVAIEANELLINSPDKWNGYKRLMRSVRTRFKAEFPGIAISESMTLHNLYKPEVADAGKYIDEVTDYMNTLDFASISFYPFFKGLTSKSDFQKAFDFLHTHIDVPVAFSETSYLSEDLYLDNLKLSISGNEQEQDDYLQTLLCNAQERDYLYTIWWAHRDYDALWETFPDEVKEIGKLWLSTGIINEDGKEKQALSSWKKAYLK